MSRLRVVELPIAWNEALPAFARASFLQSVGDEYGWLGGIDESDVTRCVLPYTIIRKGVFRMVRFRVETIALGGGFQIAEETAFLNDVVQHLRSRADIIIPGTTNAVFRTYPEGAASAPYGTYVINLTRPENALWKAIDRITRQNINSAARKGVTIRVGDEQDVEPAYQQICATFKRSSLPFMGPRSFRRFLDGLGETGRMLIAERNGTPQSYVVFAYSRYCAYAVYAGNLPDQYPGSNKLLYWEAIKWFREMGVQRYDFMGARIRPEKGSKQESINALKKRFGANLIEGYMWKYPLRPLRAAVYLLAVRWLRGGDIVDAERHKLSAEAAEETPAEAVSDASTQAGTASHFA